MKARGLKITFFAGGVALLVVMAAALGYLIEGPDLIKERLKAGLSAEFSNDAGLACDIRARLFPFGFSLTNLLVTVGDRELLQVEEAQVVFALWPLLKGETQLARLELKRPDLFLPAGLPKSRGGGQESRGASFRVDRLVVRGGNIRMPGERDDNSIVVNGLDTRLNDLARNGDGLLTFSGDLAVSELNSPKVTLRDMSARLSGTREQQILFEDLAADLFASRVTGRLALDLSSKQGTWQLQLHTKSLSLERLFEALAGEKIFSGSVAADVDLSGQLENDIARHLNGTLNVAGTDLSQYGFDLDEVIDQLQASRHINLMDIGLFAFAGPLGALVGQGVSYAGLVTAVQSSDQQEIEKLVFNWGIEEGLARTEDVAFRTRENRLAIKGAIDLETAEYKDLSIALLNTQGCALIEQDISGPLTNPVVQKGGMLGSLADSVLGILAQGWRIVDVSECQPYYQGTVKPHGVQQ